MELKNCADRNHICFSQRTIYPTHHTPSLHTTLTSSPCTPSHILPSTHSYLLTRSPPHTSTQTIDTRFDEMEHKVEHMEALVNTLLKDIQEWQESVRVRPHP